MSLTRRTLFSSLIATSGVAMAQSLTPDHSNIGFKADNGPARSEAGVGALMPWADSLWAVTYNSHTRTTGTGLGLYRIDENLKSERVHVHDGTHANRFVHGASNQMIIGPYLFNEKGEWKFLKQFADERLTATFEHLTDPANRVYMLTMEGKLYEMDVTSTQSKLVVDLVDHFHINKRPHFKGGTSGQGRVVVANNGFYEYGEEQAGLF